MISSRLDSLLDSPGATLTQVLDEIDFMQVPLCAHEKLVNFFTGTEILKELLRLIVNEQRDEVDYTVRYKGANTACEIIMLDIDAILEKITNDQKFLDILWAFAYKQPPLNPLIASGFCKVMTFLLYRKPKQIFEYLKSRDAVNTLIVHIGTAAIMELYMEFVTVVVSSKLKMEINEWLNEEKLIEQLIDRVHPYEDELKQYCAGQLLCELVRVGRYHIPPYIHKGNREIIFECPLLLTLERRETTEKLLNNILDNLEHPNSHSSFVNGVAIILCMIETRRTKDRKTGQLPNPLFVKRMNSIRETVVDAVCGRFSDVSYALLRFSPAYSIETTVGVLDPPLGKARLSISHLVASLIATNSILVIESISNTGIIDVLLDLFSSYEWHNILHASVYRSIRGILNFRIDSEEDEFCIPYTYTLIRHLFIECHLIQRCLTMWKLNDISEKSGSPRKGYMGHLTKIINEIQNCRLSGSNMKIVQAMFQASPYNLRKEWTELVSCSLEEVNWKNAIPSIELVVNVEETRSDSEDYYSNDTLYEYADKMPQVDNTEMPSQPCTYM